MDQSPTTYNVLGAGLAGSLLAVFLAQKGFRVHVFEKRPDMRKQIIDGGRSINLALSTRGIHALEQTGMIDEIMELTIPMYGRMMHAKSEALTFQAYSQNQKDCIYSISRAELNKRLMSLSESLQLVDFHFEKMSDGIDDDGKVMLRDLHSDQTFEAPGDITFACDGAFSATRYAMQKMPRFEYSQSFLPHGYKELTIPPGPDGSFSLEKNALHIWPRGDYMMIALPNLDGSFTCTLFFPFEGEKSFENLDTEEKVLEFFKEEFPDAVALMPDLVSEFFENPTSSLVTIRCYPWVKEDKIALVGDACHAIVPFFGQGMNAAFEDCSILSACIDLAAPDWERVFDIYQKERKANSDAIANMAIENFVEMRDKVADKRFLLQKKVEHKLSQTFPAYKSRYELVSFSRIPYAEAYKRGEINQKILDQLIDGLDDVANLNIELASELINKT